MRLPCPTPGCLSYGNARKQVAFEIVDAKRGGVGEPLATQAWCHNRHRRVGVRLALFRRTRLAGERRRYRRIRVGLAQLRTGADVGERAFAAKRFTCITDLAAEHDPLMVHIVPVFTRQNLQQVLLGFERLLRMGLG